MVKCTECDMEFVNETRMERHKLKAHPPKRRVGGNYSADFNHSFFPG